MTSAMPRSVAKIIFWLHRHTHRNITFMYWTILSTRVTKLEEHLCWNSRCLSHMFFHFCAETTDIIVLLFHTKMTLYIMYVLPKNAHLILTFTFFNPFCPLSLHTFGHLLIYQLHLQRNCPQAKRNECKWKHKWWMHVVLNRSLALPFSFLF